MDSQLMSALEAIRARGARVCRNAKRGGTDWKVCGCCGEWECLPALKLLGC